METNIAILPRRGTARMARMIHLALNAKLALINLAYAGLIFAFMLAEQALDYTAKLPHPTLAGVGLIVAGIGGVMSWLWERRKNKNASLRTNISFACGIGILVGLLSYDYLVTKNDAVNLWLGCLIAAGFANQVCWGLVAIVVRKKVSDVFHLEQDGENTPAQKKESD